MTTKGGNIFNGIKLGVILGFIESIITFLMVSHSNIIAYFGPNIYIREGWQQDHLLRTVLIYSAIGCSLGVAFIVIEFFTKKHVPYLTVLIWSILGSTIIFAIFDTILIMDIDYKYYPIKRVITLLFLLTITIICCYKFPGSDQKIITLETKSYYILIPLMTGLLGIIDSYWIDTLLWQMIEQYRFEVIIISLMSGVAGGLLWCLKLRQLKKHIIDSKKLIKKGAIFAGLATAGIFLISLLTTVIINQPDVVLLPYIIFCTVNIAIFGFIPGFIFSRLIIPKMLSK